MIRQIEEETGATLEMEDDGTVRIGSPDGESLKKAKDWVLAIAFPPEAEMGKEYEGEIVNITSFGAFVNILPGRDGLLHISKMGGGKRVERVEDVFALGDRVTVVVRDIDRNGKVSLDLPGAAPAGEGDEGRRPEGGYGDRDRGGDRGGDRDRGPRGGGDRDRGAGETVTGEATAGVTRAAGRVAISPGHEPGAISRGAISPAAISPAAGASLRAATARGVGRAAPWCPSRTTSSGASRPAAAFDDVRRAACGPPSRVPSSLLGSNICSIRMWGPAQGGGCYGRGGAGREDGPGGLFVVVPGAEPARVLGLVGPPGSGLTRLGLSLLADPARRGPVAVVDVRGWLLPPGGLGGGGAPGAPGGGALCGARPVGPGHRRPARRLACGVRRGPPRHRRGPAAPPGRPGPGAGALALILRPLRGDLPAGLAHLNLVGEAVRWEGAGPGHGRITRRWLTLRAAGRGVGGIDQVFEVVDDGTNALRVVPRLAAAPAGRTAG